MKLMVVEINGTAYQFSCVQCPIPPVVSMTASMNDVIPIYYSYQEAVKAGWTFTKEERYSPDGKAVAVCPKCYESREVTNGG